MVLLNPDWVGSGDVAEDFADMQTRFDRAIGATLDSKGQNCGLAAVAWDVVNTSEGLIVSGTIHGSGAIEQCQAWADALGMAEYVTTLEDDGREWVSTHGPWRIELQALPSSSADNAHYVK